MQKSFNLKQELRSPEVVRFEKRYAEATGRQTALRDIPIKNFVDVSSNLLETKVAATFMRGASEASGFWPNLIKVVEMKAPKEDVPIISQRDFKVRTGRISGTALEESGGRFRSVSLDTTDDEHRRYVHLRIDAEDVRIRNFDVVEQSINAAGQAFGKNILTDIISKYVNKAGNSQAKSTDAYFLATMKAIAKNKADGFGCSAIIIDYDDYTQAVTEETTNGAMPWLMSNGPDSMPALGDNFARNFGEQDGIVGRLFGRIPVYAVSNDSTLSGNILCVDTMAAAVLGLAPGGQIRLEQEVKRVADLVDNVISAKYQIVNPDDDGSGNSNAVAKVTGA